MNKDIWQKRTDAYGKECLEYILDLVEKEFKSKIDIEIKLKHARQYIESLERECRE